MNARPTWALRGGLALRTRCPGYGSATSRTFDIILMFLYIGSQFAVLVADGAQGRGQQKMIAYVMPLMIGMFMFIYKWPAGLFIYWITSNVWTIAQQFVAREDHAGSRVRWCRLRRQKTTPARVAGKSPARATARPRQDLPGRPLRAHRRVRRRLRAERRQDAGSGGREDWRQDQWPKAGQQGKPAGSPGQRPNRGTGRSKGSGGAGFRSRRTRRGPV